MGGGWGEGAGQGPRVPCKPAGQATPSSAARLKLARFWAMPTDTHTHHSTRQPANNTTTTTSTTTPGFHPAFHLVAGPECLPQKLGRRNPLTPSPSRVQLVSYVLAPARQAFPVARIGTGPPMGTGGLQQQGLGSCCVETVELGEFCSR